MKAVISKWKRDIYESIRERDNGCVICGTFYYHGEGTALMAPCIHHIDNNPLNNKRTNLITLCHSCHTWLHKHQNEIQPETGRTPIESLHIYIQIIES